MTTLDSAVPLPAEVTEKPKTTRKRAAPKAKTEEAANPATSLLKALKFISVAQKKAGTPSQQFSNLSFHWAAASDGILTVATRIEEDLTACPHTLSFIDALSKCSGDLAITQLSPQTLAVNSGVFKGLINCADFEAIQIPAPDPVCAAIDDRIRDALAAVSVLATDGAPNAVHAAVLLQANSAVATNGHALLEYWHGIDLPPGMLIPKASAVAIVKAGKPLTGFGYSPSSATFWFQDGSFIKTQLYNERYPVYEHVINVEGLNPWALPVSFFKGVKAIESFTEDGIVYFNKGVLNSNRRLEEASTYKIEGLPDDMAFSAKYLLMVESAMQKVDFRREELGSKAYFFGPNVRGVLMGIRLTSAERAEYSADNDGKPKANFSDMDEDFPF